MTMNDVMMLILCQILQFDVLIKILYLHVFMKIYFHLNFHATHCFLFNITCPPTSLFLHFVFVIVTFRLKVHFFGPFLVGKGLGSYPSP
jgi:hypothetical protein